MEDALAIAERHFAPAEVAALRACAGDDERQRRFFSAGTLQEAYLKAVGRGLSLPLQAVSFAFEPGGVDSRVVAGADAARGAGMSGAGSRWEPQPSRPTPC